MVRDGISGSFSLSPCFLFLVFCSFFLLSLALKGISIGTGYAVWTGIGAAGSVLVGMYLFNEKKSRLKLFFLSCIICGVVGLKLFG